MIPDAGKVRDLCAAGRPGRRHGGFRQGGRRRARQYDEYEEIPVPVHANLPFMVFREITIFREITKALARSRGLGWKVAMLARREHPRCR
jgi:hypothetical protein